MDVRVGQHVAPRGGLGIPLALGELLVRANAWARGDEKEVPDALDPYQAHVAYETLHPFMDGNGRSGRALWAWMHYRRGHEPFELPFLHRWYYESLAHSQGRK
jgi:hypothetical protein